MLLFGRKTGLDIDPYTRTLAQVHIHFHRGLNPQPIVTKRNKEKRGIH